MNTLVTFAKIINGKTVYLSGPMTNIERKNAPAFRNTEQTLKDHFDCTIITPIRHVQSDKLPYEYYMSIAMIDVEHADIIILLDGWHNSPGANREYKKALELKKTIIPMWEIERELEKIGGRA